MKKIKLLNALGSISIIGAIAPIVTLASCNKGDDTPTSNYHTVKFDTQVQGLTVDSQKVENNKCAIEPAVRRDGYQVTAWTCDDKVFSFTTPITSDITLKAVWEEISTGGGNLDSIQYPTIAPAAYTEYASTDAIVEAYLTAIKNNTDIFRQDILYSWSYTNLAAKLQIYKIISFDKHTSNVTIDKDNIVVDVDNKTIEFDAEIKTNIKIKDSVEKSWIEWLGWNFRSIESTSKLHFKLCLTDDVREKEHKAGYEDMNTSIDLGHVRYIDGICGIRYNYDSTVKVVSESGTMIDLDGQTKEYSKTESAETKIVDPDEVALLKTDYIASSVLIDSFINFDAENSESRFAASGWIYGSTESEQVNGEYVGYKFASTYMAASNLNKDHIFEFVSLHNTTSGNVETRVVGINRAYDTLHFEWILEDMNNTFTLPDGYDSTSTGTITYGIEGRAFDQTLEKAHILPENCKINLSKNTTLVDYKAFFNNSIAEIYIPSKVDGIRTYALSKYDGETTGCVSDVVRIDSSTIADNLTSETSCGYLVGSVKTVKLNNNLTATTYITSNFTRGEDETIGGVTYQVWNRSE